MIDANKQRSIDPCVDGGIDPIKHLWFQIVISKQANIHAKDKSLRGAKM